ncbi:hypothetical protein DF188_06780 [Aliarcobacter skirrowii]|uniref:DNA recombination protein RmuC n=1 Tax=Aliarcobacter skirrowii TaxID=28200 RepID=A0A2U2BZM6_9BACT|nr:hypothetical protein [Aliarcobacter skirrowii]PWE20882.1 hypothetical protein DF188_06780 [Aliarcobacter skirrowii]
MIDMNLINNMLMLVSLFIGALLGGFIYFFIQKIFLMGLKSYIEKSAKKFEDSLEQSQISAFVKLKEIQNEYEEKFNELYMLIQNTESSQKHLNQKIDNFRVSLHNLNIEIKDNANTKKELECEIVKLKNIINRLQKKDKNNE